MKLPNSVEKFLLPIYEWFRRCHVFLITIIYIFYNLQHFCKTRIFFFSFGRLKIIVCFFIYFFFLINSCIVKKINSSLRKKMKPSFHKSVVISAYATTRRLKGLLEFVRFMYMCVHKSIKKYIFEIAFTESIHPQRWA